METVMGSIECIIGNESRAIVVEAATLEAVPTIAAAVWNLRNVKSVAAGDAVARWKAIDVYGAEAQVVLWEEPPLPGPLLQMEEGEAI